MTTVSYDVFVGHPAQNALEYDLTHCIITVDILGDSPTCHDAIADPRNAQKIGSFGVEPNPKQKAKGKKGDYYKMAFAFVLGN